LKPQSNTNLVNQNVGKQRKKCYGKITTSFVFLTLPMGQRWILKSIYKQWMRYCKVWVLVSIKHTQIKKRIRWHWDLNHCSLFPKITVLTRSANSDCSNQPSTSICECRTKRLGKLMTFNPRFKKKWSECIGVVG
jgi:hypothetical protein